jgi:hypothetical protein
MLENCAGSCADQPRRQYGDDGEFCQVVVLRVVWTLADLAGLPTPGGDQVAEALGMRLQRVAA